MALGCGLVALFRGYLRPAWLWLREASELLREEDPVGALPLALALAAQALGQSGDTVGATKAAMAADEARRPGSSLADPMVLLGRAWAAAAEGAFTEARRAALTASDLAEERGTLTLGFKTAHDLVRLGDAEAGATRLSRLAGSVQGPLIDACAEHAQAMVTQDPRRLETAASALTKLGALLWAAEAESAAASAYRGPAGRQAPEQRRLVPRCCSSAVGVHAHRRSRPPVRWSSCHRASAKSRAWPQPAPPTTRSPHGSSSRFARWRTTSNGPIASSASPAAGNCRACSVLVSRPARPHAKIE